MFLLTVVLAEIIPTGVTETTTLGAFGPVVFAISVAFSLATGAIVMYLRVKNLVRHDVQEWVESRPGREALHEFLWEFVKGGDFEKWQRQRIIDGTESNYKAVMEKLDSLTKLFEAVTVKLDKMWEKQHEHDLELDRHRRAREKSLDNS